MFQKIFAYIVLFCLLVGFAPFVSAQTFTGFEDVQRQSRYYKSVHSLIDSGAITPNKYFYSYRPVNRAEAVKMILAATDRTNYTVSDSLMPSTRFYDVNTTDWFFPYVNAAVDQGITRGYEDGTFRPGQTINLVEALKIMFYSFNIAVDTQGSSTHVDFFRNDPMAWYSPFINTASRHSLLANYEYINPGRSLSRGDFAELLYRFQLFSQGDKRYLSYLDSQFTISIPRLNIFEAPLLTTDPFDEEYYLWVLNKGIGHALKYPGEGGKIFLYGHSSGYSWYNPEYREVFRALNKLEDGDDIIVRYMGKVYTYRVTGREVRDPNDLSVLEDSPKEELAILTCWPPDSLRERYMIYADKVSSVAYNN